MAKTLYLDDTYLFEAEAQVIAQQQDEKGVYFLLDQTIFYPQGGGQPTDQGVLKNSNVQIRVNFVRQIGAEIRHYVEEDDINISGSVICIIDKERRILNARYHTAAHLLSNVVEDLYHTIKAVKGHSFPKEAYVEFVGANELEVTIINQALRVARENKLTTRVFTMSPINFADKFYKLPYEIPENKDFRIMQIDNYLPIPCGGTHVKTIEEIGEILIRKITYKNDRIKIGYDIY